MSSTAKKSGYPWPWLYRKSYPNLQFIYSNQFSIHNYLVHNNGRGKQQMRGDFGNHTNSKSFLNQLTLLPLPPNLVHSGFITTISGLPKFSSGDPQQQWWVGNAGLIFVQKSDKQQIISQSTDSYSLAPKFGTERLHHHHQRPTKFQQWILSGVWSTATVVSGACMHDFRKENRQMH